MGPLDAFVSRADGSMLVVTVAVGDDLSGCLVGFHTQVSIEPMRYAVCLSEKNATFEAAGHAEALGVHLLRDSQGDLASLFGEYTKDDGLDKFACCSWDREDGRPPILAGVLAWFYGTVVDRVTMGDHTAFILEPTAHGGSAAGKSLRYGAASSLLAGH